MAADIRSAIQRNYPGDDTETASNATLLFYIQLTLTFFLLITLVVVALSTPAYNLLVYLLIPFVSLVAIIVSMVGTLHGQYRISLWVTISLLFAGPWISILFEHLSHSRDFLPMFYVTIPVQITALFLAIKPTLLIALLQAVALSLLILTDPLRGSYNWASLLCFIIASSMLGTITSYVLRRQYERMVLSKNALIVSEQKLLALSLHDPLTGLFNRRYMNLTFQDLLSEPASRLAR